MLKNLTQTFKDNCNAREVILSEYVILDNIQIPVKAEINDDCYDEGNFVGNFIFKELRFETSNEYDFKKKEFEYYKVVNGESAKIGTFITTEITDNDTEETIKVVAMDYGLKTQVEYTSELNYGAGNVTLLDVWNENCELSGIESGITSFTNSNFIVDSDQFSGTGATRRDVFIAIAQSSCDFVKVANDDKIYLVLSEETNEVIEEYTNLEDKRDTQPINAVSLGMSQVEGENVTKIADGVSEKNANWLVINDNPFAYTQEKRQQLINEIFNKINGFGYSAFKTETSFKPYLTCGDLVKFKRKDGVLVDSIILRYKHNFDNIILEAPSITKATVNYVRPESAIDIVKRTEFIVDKQNQEIKSVVNQIGDRSEKTSTITQDIDGLSSKVSDIENLKRESFGTNFLYLENASNGQLLYLKIKGQFSLIYPSNDLFPSEQLYPVDSYLIVDKTEELSGEAKRIKLPINYLNNEDVFIYDYGECRIERNDGTIEQYGNLNIELFDGDNYIYLENFKDNNLIFNVIYAIKSDFTDLFATKVELNSSITQTKDEINLEVSKKVDENEVISTINLTSEEAKINAQKITLEGIVTANENFKVLEDGSIEAINGKFNGNVKGSIFKGNSNDSIELKIGTNIEDTYLPSDNSLVITRGDDTMFSVGARYWSQQSLRQLVLGGNVKFFSFSGYDNQEVVQAYEFRHTGGGFNAGSLESIKKNISNFNGALDIINNTNIYTYNMKIEDDKHKKHIGCIIPDEDGDYQTSEIIMTEDKKAIDLYSMISVLWQGVKEQQQQIKELKKEINLLKEE